MSDLKSIKNKLSSLRAKIKAETPAAASSSVAVPPPTSTATITPAVVAKPPQTNTEKKPKANNKKPKAKKNAPSTTTSSEKPESTTTTTTTITSTTSTTLPENTTTPSVESAATTTTEKKKPTKKSAAKQKKDKKPQQQGVKRKQPSSEEQGESTSESKKDDTDKKKKNKNKKSKKAIKAAIKTFVLKIVNDNMYITEDKVKECFPEQNSILRMGPRMILIQFPTEESAMTFLKPESGEVLKTRSVEISGEKFKIAKHTVKEIFNPRWFDVKPRVTQGVSLGLEKGQKVNAKFGPYLELYLKEKLGNDVNTTISDLEKGITVYFEDSKVEEKLKTIIESGAFKVPQEYINDRKAKQLAKEPARKKTKRF